MSTRQYCLSDPSETRSKAYVCVLLEDGKNRGTAVEKTETNIRRIINSWLAGTPAKEIEGVACDHC